MSYWIELDDGNRRLLEAANGTRLPPAAWLEISQDVRTVRTYEADGTMRSETTLGRPLRVPDGVTVATQSPFADDPRNAPVPRWAWGFGAVAVVAAVVFAFRSR